VNVKFYSERKDVLSVSRISIKPTPTAYRREKPQYKIIKDGPKCGPGSEADTRYIRNSTNGREEKTPEAPAYRTIALKVAHSACVTSQNAQNASRL
jgi:hypothetical protein